MVNRKVTKVAVTSSTQHAELEWVYTTQQLQQRSMIFLLHTLKSMISETLSSLRGLNCVIEFPLLPESLYIYNQIRQCLYRTDNTIPNTTLYCIICSFNELNKLVSMTVTT